MTTQVRLLCASWLLAAVACAGDGEPAEGAGSTTAGGSDDQDDVGGDTTTLADDGDVSSGGDGAAGDDDSPTDGSTGDPTCEADVITDPENCGACGHDCLGGLCTSGRCEPRLLTQGGREVHPFGAFAWADDEWYRFDEPSATWKMLEVGTHTTGLVVTRVLTEHGFLSTAHNNTLLEPLELAKFDGSTEILASEVSRHFDGFAGVVAYTRWDSRDPDNDQQTIYRGQLSDGDFEPIIDGHVRVLNVGAVATFVRRNISTEVERYAVVAIPHGSTEPETVYEGEEYAEHVWLGDDFVYFREAFDQDGLYRAPRGSSDAATRIMAAVHNIDGGRGSASLLGDTLLYIHANEIRWVGGDTDLSGTTLLTFPDEPRSMALIDGALYVIADGGLYRLVLPADF